MLNEVICYMQVFQYTGVYGSSASQILDLGVSELCLYSYAHVLSLKSIEGFCHGIAKWEDCKIVIYNYVYVGFNSVSNLIVFLFNHFPVFLWDLI